MADLTITVDGNRVPVYLGENTERAANSADRAEEALATATELVAGLEPYGPMLADASGTREIVFGYAGDFSSTNYNDYTGEIVSGGPRTYYFRPVPGAGQPLELELHTYSGLAGNGDITLLVLSGTYPNLHVEQALALEVVTTGASTLDISALDPVEAGQHFAIAVASGGPIILLFQESGQFSALRTPDGFADTGDIAFVTSGGNYFTDYSIGARIRMEVPALSVGVDNLAVDLAGIEYLATANDPVEYDLWLMIGHSQAQGHSEETNPLTLPAGIAKQYYSGALTELTADPVGPAVGSSAWIAFTLGYHARTGRGVIAVPQGVGGSTLISAGILGVDNWSPAGGLRQTARNAMNAAKAAADTAGLPVRFGGVICALGGNDGAHKDLRYGTTDQDLNGNPITKSNLVAGYAGLAAYYRTQFAQPYLPFILWRDATYGDGDDTGIALVRQAQDEAAAADRDMHIGFAGGLTWYDRGLMVDSVGHGSAAALNEAGFALAQSAAAVFAG